MSDLGFNLAASEACVSGNGEYYAQVYLLKDAMRPGVDRRRVYLGKKQPRPERLTTFLKRVLDLEVIPINLYDKLIGVSVLRLCENRPHARRRLERVASLAFASPDSMQPIKPLTLRVIDGIGFAQPAEGRPSLQPIIDFPTTYEERIHSPPLQAVEASVSRPNQPAYIALRGLERLVGVEEYDL